MKMSRYSLALACFSWIHGFAAAADVDFAHDIAPLLQKRCGGCHMGEHRRGGLSMNTRQLFLAGGDGGPAWVDGQPDRSELLRRVTADDDLRMPPEGQPLSDREVAALRAWIDQKAPWTAGFSFRGAAYEPPLRPRVVVLPPAVEGREHPIDRLVDAYARRPSPPATPRAGGR